ncbi:allantoicase [Friedmanniella luteola]|uniref:Probable allantoicase n=1 Tax=Friedmanniella luteola TaxID=546871 RepID=A0A1H1ZSD6_9ACTN|nr:allantoicase [Friedmanniella luteola]SDT36570.1 allantoicase [Friedmanniella luteola]
MTEFRRYPDLASRDLAGSVVSANDELFAPRQSLIVPGPAVHAVDAFGHSGKIYDGWETRRRREPGQDWAVVRLGVPGIVHGVVVDTAFFRGNYPPFVSVEAVSVEGYPPPAALEQLAWTTLVERSACGGDRENLYAVTSDRRWTHVRLTIDPDGGVARFRVHGEAVLDPRELPGTVDLLALENGGRLLDTSDAFYSSPENLIRPGRARIMGEGWENARRRGPGNDWALFRLAARGEPTQLEVDTSYFVGNAPGQVRVSAADEETAPLTDPASWWDLLPRVPVLVDTRHRFAVHARRPATHLRIDVHPDGGLSRLRCWGELPRAERERLTGRFRDSLPEHHVVAVAPVRPG